MWWSRKSRIEAFEAYVGAVEADAKRPDIKEDLDQAAPISHEIDDLLRSKGISTWTAIVALAACLRAAAADATEAGPFKGYLRVAHRFVENVFWVTYREYKKSAKG